MSMPASILIGLGALALAVLAIFELAKVYAEGGLKLFFWPKLRHGYEVTPATRLAVVPWGLLLVLLGGNGAVIALFGHDLAGNPAGGFWPWLAAAAVPMAMIHLIDYRRSVAAAAIGLLLLALGSLYLVQAAAAWGWLPLLVLFVLWSLNGVRAVHADRSMR